MSNNLLVYDTKYGSTEIIARWISELADDIEVKKPDEVKSINKYSKIIIGSPDYDDSPLKSIVNFMENFKEELKEKKIAIFVVCNDVEESESEGKVLGGKYNLDILKRYLPKENVVLEGILGGVFNPKILDEEDQEVIMKFFERLGHTIKKEDLIFMPVMNKLDRIKCKEFIDKFNKI